MTRGDEAQIQRTDDTAGAGDESGRRYTRALLANNLVAALIALTLMVFVHEVSHLVAGLALGYPGEIFAFRVLHIGDPSVADDVIMTLTGPAFSLVTGLVMVFWMPLRHRRDFGHLIWLWFAFASVQEGVTYLCLTPFGVGDTGYVAELLEMPVFVRFIVLAIGIGGMFLTARLFAPHLIRHSGGELRNRNAMGLFVWLYGMIAMVLLNFVYLLVTQVDVDMAPGEQIAVMVGGTALLVFAPMANIFSRQVSKTTFVPLKMKAVPVSGLVVLALLIIGNVLLSLGLRVG